MRERRRWTVHDLRRDNRSVLLSSLFFEQPRSRQQLSEATGLSPASVSNVVRDLIDEGIVVEVDSVGSDGGRPRALLQVSPDYGYIVGVDVSETRVRVELFDLTMTGQARADYPLDPGHEVSLIVAAILSGLEAVLAHSGVNPAAVLGIGVGIPGIVENGPDGLVHGQAFGWESVPLGRLLRSGTRLPLYIENGVKAMGQAEMWFGAGRGAQSVVACLIGSGVGASIIANGAALRGATSSAGEWGHTTVMVDGRTCRCGLLGCLEAYVGAEAILDQYGSHLPGSDQEAELAALIDLAATSARAAEILDTTALYLGVSIADLINLFNPERIILGGWAGLLLGEYMLPAIRAVARERSLRHLFAQTSIGLGHLGPDAVALGAAALPIKALLSGNVFPTREAASPPARRGAARVG
ncbi:MAG TPA: ROK family transcriptional regulator [Trebonia sp.]|jgi:predicted NBD/HSP70 family sugar kinase/biotin operon repressor|nr:ROK family transcriptional regulator [Trebonia sp.]